MSPEARRVAHVSEDQNGHSTCRSLSRVHTHTHREEHKLILTSSNVSSLLREDMGERERESETG